MSSPLALQQRLRTACSATLTARCGVPPLAGSVHASNVPAPRSLTTATDAPSGDSAMVERHANRRVVCGTRATRSRGSKSDRGRGTDAMLCVPLLRQHRRELGGVADGLVAVAVVHEEVHLVRFLAQLLDLRHPARELALRIEVVEAFGGREPGLLPVLLVAPVETDDRERRRHLRDGRDG